MIPVRSNKRCGASSSPDSTSRAPDRLVHSEISISAPTPELSMRRTPLRSRMTRCGRPRSSQAFFFHCGADLNRVMHRNIVRYVDPHSAVVCQYVNVLHMIDGRHSILHIPARRSRYALGANRRVHEPVFYESPPSAASQFAFRPSVNKSCMSCAKFAKSLSLQTGTSSGWDVPRQSM